MNRSIASVLVGGLIMTASMSPAHAQDEKSVSRIVNYTDLDLTHPDDVLVLKERVRKAASEICGDRDDTRDLNAYHNIWACRAEAISGARAQISMAVNRAMQLASSKADHGAPVQTSSR
jgi:UrcA family protein